MNKPDWGRICKLDKNSKEYQQEKLLVDTTCEICEVMNKKGISKMELAKRLNITYEQLVEILDCEADITLRMLADIMYAMGTSASVKGE